MLLNPGPFSRRCSALWWKFQKLAVSIIDTNVGQLKHFILHSKPYTHASMIAGEIFVVEADRSSPFLKLTENSFLSEG